MRHRVDWHAQGAAVLGRSTALLLWYVNFGVFACCLLHAVATSCNPSRTAVGSAVFQCVRRAACLAAWFSGGLSVFS